MLKYGQNKQIFAAIIITTIINAEDKTFLKKNYALEVLLLIKQRVEICK